MKKRRKLKEDKRVVGSVEWTKSNASLGDVVVHIDPFNIVYGLLVGLVVGETKDKITVMWMGPASTPDKSIIVEERSKNSVVVVDSDEVARDVVESRKIMIS